jgi:hypothetical protein
MNPVVPPTAAGKLHKRRLMFVMGAHLILSIMMMFLGIFLGI